jgi:hypothetical protein
MGKRSCRYVLVGCYAVYSVVYNEHKAGRGGCTAVLNAVS